MHTSMRNMKCSAQCLASPDAQLNGDIARHHIAPPAKEQVLDTQGVRLEIRGCWV